MNGNVKYNVAFLILFLFARTFGQNYNGENPVSLHYDNVPLAKVLDDIQKRQNVIFIYDDNLAKDIRVSCSAEKPDLKKALSFLLKDKHVSFKFFNESTVVLFKTNAEKKKARTVIIKNEEKPDAPKNLKFNNVKLLTKAEPGYPPLAVQYGIEGKVTVKIFVSEKGAAIKTQINKSSGYRILDSAAINYSKKLKFEPAHQNGKPVSAWTKIAYEFYILPN
ncbi:MAG: TonB family protein [Chlorobi bacterium]|nr:TonB family protein [Chlorobiota bacterium]